LQISAKRKPKTCVKIARGEQFWDIKPRKQVSKASQPKTEVAENPNHNQKKQKGKCQPGSRQSGEERVMFRKQKIRRKGRVAGRGKHGI